MRLLWALLPVVVLGGIWALMCANGDAIGLDRLSRRGRLVVAFVAFEAVVLATTEVLSVGHHLTAGSVRATWAVLAAVTLVACITRLPRPRQGALGRWLEGVPPAVKAWPLEVTIGAALLAAMGLVLVWIGLLYAPNNTDSLVYHLTRVAHWIQDQSVAHYATHWTGQIELAPLHEFNMLHVQELTGSDRLDGFVQLGAFVVAVLACSEICRLLGGDRVAQMTAAVIAAVIPSAVLEATSTQNNVFGAAIGLGIIVILLGWTAEKRWLAPAVLLGLGIGLAAIAKGTVLVVVGPLALMLTVRLVVGWARIEGWSRVARRVGASAAVALVAMAVMAAPFFARNRAVFGSISGPVSAEQINAQFDPGQSIGNVIRSVAVNFRIGDGDGDVETAVAKTVRAPLRWLYDRTGATFDDLDYAIPPTTDVFATGDFSLTSRFEEFGVNPWHMLLVVPAVVVLVLTRRRPPPAGPALLVASGAALGFVAFAITNRWSVYVPRYYLPAFFLWSPVIALALGRLGRLVRSVVVIALVVAVVPQLLDNWPRSLLHRRDVPIELDAYFVGRSLTEPTASTDFANVRDAILASGCQQVGITNWILLEYPLWAGLRQAGWKGTMEHVDVDNDTGVLSDDRFEPCLLVRQTSGPAFCDGHSGTEVAFGSLSVLEPDTPFVRCAPISDG